MDIRAFLMPKSAGPDVSLVGKFDPKAFLPVSQSDVRYMGSLAILPCSEGLAWTVIRDPIEAFARTDPSVRSTLSE